MKRGKPLEKPRNAQATNAFALLGSLVLKIPNGGSISPLLILKRDEFEIRPGYQKNLALMLPPCPRATHIGQ